MDALIELWLPIVISAVAVFLAAFVLHVISKHHKGDYAKVPNEDAFLDAIRGGGARAGFYIFPFCENPAELKDPEKKARYDRGPHGFMSLSAGPWNIGTNMIKSVIFYLVVGVFVAYITSEARPWGAEYLSVFQMAGTAAILAYCFGFVHLDIWFKRPMRNTVMDVIDGIVYGLLTAGIFGWLWPSGM